MDNADQIPRWSQGRTAGKKTQVGAKGTYMPNFKMIGPVVSEIIRDILLPLAPASHPRWPRGRAAGKKT